MTIYLIRSVLWTPDLTILTNGYTGNLFDSYERVHWLCRGKPCLPRSTSAFYLASIQNTRTERFLLLDVA